jgi:hypothetical protein
MAAAAFNMLPATAEVHRSYTALATGFTVRKSATDPDPDGVVGKSAVDGAVDGYPCPSVGPEMTVWKSMVYAPF